MEKTTNERVYSIAERYLAPKGGKFVLDTDEFQPALSDDHVITDVWMDVLPKGESNKIEGFTVYMHFLMDGAYNPGTITFKVKSTAQYTIEKNIDKMLGKDLSKFTDSCKGWIENFFGVADTKGVYIDDDATPDNFRDAVKARYDGIKAESDK